jgi:hypothetical protein
MGSAERMGAAFAGTERIDRRGQGFQVGGGQRPTRVASPAATADARAGAQHGSPWPVTGRLESAQLRMMMLDCVA